MTSIDSASCKPDVSEILRGVRCGPCKADKIQKQANYYCKECVEHLCNSCKDYHTKMKVTENHTILSDDKIPVPTSGKQVHSFVPYCTCNKNQAVEFFCEDHRDVVCDQCKRVNHQHCKLVKIQEKSADYTNLRLSAVLIKLKGLVFKVNNILELNKSSSEEFNCLRHESKKEIQEIRLKINACLDSLEDCAMKELDEYYGNQQQNIEKQMSPWTAASKVLALDSQKLEDSATDGNKFNMFTVDVQISKHISEYETTLSDSVKNDLKPVKTFEGIKKLTDIQTYISSLGNPNETYTNLASSAKCENTFNFSKKVLLGKKAQLKCQANVKSRDDKLRPSISGCTFMSDGSVVLCDNANNKLKSLDTDLLLKESLKLSSSPWDLSIVDNSKVIITLPRIQQLQYIQIFPQLMAGRRIHLDKAGRGIEVFGGEIYTTYIDKKGEGGVIVFDLNGKMKKQISVNGEKPFLCRFPFYITVNRSEKIFISYGSVDTGTVACMSADGNVFYEYKNKDFKNARGMYIDGENNIFVCDKVSNNIQVITSAGKHHGILLSALDGIKQPYSIAYREIDGTLLVGCSDQECVFIFKL